jgi:glycine oxidase
VNVTIAGAGVIGCAIAHELAARGARVRVLDQRGPGGGATRASAGILAPYVEGHDPTLLRLTLRSLALYDDFLERVTGDAGEPVEYERRGTVQVGLNLDEANRLKRAARILGETRVEHGLLTASDVRRLEPSVTPAAVGGLHIPQQGYVAVGELTRALTAAAMRHGAAFDVGSAVAVHGGNVARVETPTDVIESDILIIAAGSWSSSINGSKAPADAVKPIRGQLLQLRLPQRLAERIIWGSDCYLVSRRDGAVLVGATVEDAGFDERATASGVQQLLQSAQTLMPALREAAFEEVRVGLRPMTRDELPAIGPSSTMPHVFYATGHYRNGILLAPLTARLVADLVLDGTADDDLALLRPERIGL